MTKGRPRAGATLHLASAGCRSPDGIHARARSSGPDTSTSEGAESFVSLLANVRAPRGARGPTGAELQLRLGGVLSAMPAAAIDFVPRAQQPFEQIAEVASEWVLRAELSGLPVRRP